MRKQIILAAFPLLMGFTMPQCPGQAELQGKLDQHQTVLDSLQKRVTEAETQIKTLGSDMAQAKNIFTQIATALQEQATKTDAMSKTLEEIKTQLAPKAKAHKKK